MTWFFDDTAWRCPIRGRLFGQCSARVVKATNGGYTLAGLPFPLIISGFCCFQYQTGRTPRQFETGEGYHTEAVKEKMEKPLRQELLLGGRKLFGREYA